MGLANVTVWCGRGSVTVQTESHGRHGMRMSMVIEITGMACLAVFAANCAYCAAA